MENKSRINIPIIIKSIFLILILIVLFLIIQSTYSKYIEKPEKTTDFKISSWNISINDINISESHSFSENLELNFEENPNVSKDVVVPNSIGSFEIKIDSTGTNIPFEYKVSIEDSGISSFNIEDFKIISYEIDDTTTELTPDARYATGIINPPENISDDSIHTIKFNVQWYDVDSTTSDYDTLGDIRDRLNNYQDAEKASKSPSDGTENSLKKVIIPVKVTVTQVNSNTSEVSNTITE